MSNKKIFNLFLGIGVILVLLLYFIMAVSLPPTDIIFEGNSTPVADSDGVFTINWTDGGQNVTGNYTIYLWMDNNYVSSTPNANTSALGYAWSNATEANYTFAISAVNTTNDEGVNSSNVSMYVDGTAPLVNWTNSGYTNATYKQNTTLLTLNISVGDASSGLTNSYCVFDINGTNETVAVDSGWCNTTQLNLTGLADGNHSIDIWANDTVGNVGVNLSTYVVWVDNTDPVATFTCSPTSVNSGATVTCTCTGTDTGVGVNSSLTTAAATITTNATLGTFTTTDNCTITDYAGNTHNATTTYTVTSDAATDSTSSTTTAVVVKWTGTFVINDNQFIEGYTKQVEVKGRVKFKVENIEHYMGVLELTETTAKIEVASTPQEATLAIGDTRKFNVNEDEYYDLLVTLNSISNSKADITIKAINELVSAESESEEQTKEETAKAGDVETDKESSSFLTKWWFWLIVVLVVVGIGYSAKGKNNSQ